MGLYEDFHNEPVKRLALREPIVLGPDVTVRDAIAKMCDKNLGCVVVVDEAQKPIGMFTEGMLRHLLVSSPDAIGDSLQKQMASRFPWVQIDDPIQMVLDAMVEKNTRFVCVVDEAGKLVGLTGQKGLMEHVAEHFPLQVMVQHIEESPYISQREGA